MVTTPARSLRALGNFNLLYTGEDGAPAPGLTNPRLRALLTYLALRRDAPQQRAHIAFLFWPDALESQARNNLRQSLHQLRQALPDVERLLLIDARTLQWAPSAPVRFDVAEFEEWLTEADLAASRGDPLAQRAALERADRRYTGDLLPDCFDEWVLPERERLRLLRRRALDELLRLLEAQGDTRAAIHFAQRLLAMDPLSEDYYRRLMRLFGLNHDRASALHTYHTCVSILQREMGVEPSAETRAVYERLLAQESPAGLGPLESEAPLQASSPEGPGAQPASRLAATPSLTGRAREWERLREAWLRANQGGPHMALISGEPGVGKSRLAEEFLLWAGQQGAVTASARSYAVEGQLSLAPVTDWLRSEGLRAPLRRLDNVWLTELARLLPELYSERPTLPRYEPVNEIGQRQRFFEALALAILAAPQPILLALDDMQWLDQETLAWLHLLMRRESSARLLIVGCAREEDLTPQSALRAFLLHLRSESAVTEIALEPLDAAESARLAAQVAQREVGEQEGLRLYHATRGNPLFVIEMMRADHERGARAATRASGPFHQPEAAEAQSLPPRMYAVLAGRLIQLSPDARALAEQAATIGRAFTLDLVSAVGEASAESAARALDELWRKRIVREHGANSYDFAHDKLREVAYAELGAPQRQLLHRRVARALEADHAGDLDVVSGELASHYERAGMIEQAIPYYQRAAAVAQGVYANEDAIGLLLRGLEAVRSLPASAKRDHHELDLLLTLSTLYRMTRGWTAPELERALDRALALCDTVGDNTHRAQTLFGLQSVYVVQARLDRVQVVYDEVVGVYERALGQSPPPFAGLMLAGARLHLGKIAEACAQFDAILSTPDPDQFLQLEESQGANYGALAMAWQSHALWLLGYPERAVARAREAIQLVRDLDQPFNLAMVSTYLALLQQLCADPALALTHAEQALAFSNTYLAPYYRNWANVLVTYGQALARLDAERIQALRESIAVFGQSSAELRVPYYLSLLADIYARAGQFEEGLSCIESALAQSRNRNERCWDPELHRLRGELLRMSGAEASACEAALLRAIEIARDQLAKSLELRATTSLARLWIAEGRENEATSRLAEIYGWFKEGFDTPDLQTARRLLTDG